MISWMGSGLLLLSHHLYNISQSRNCPQVFSCLRAGRYSCTDREHAYKTADPWKPQILSCTKNNVWLQLLSETLEGSVFSVINSAYRLRTGWDKLKCLLYNYRQHIDTNTFFWEMGCFITNKNNHCTDWRRRNIRLNQWWKKFTDLLLEKKS